MKGDFLRTLGILNNNFTNAQNQEAAEIYAVSYKYLIDELPKLKDDQPDLANPSFGKNIQQNSFEEDRKSNPFRWFCH